MAAVSAHGQPPLSPGVFPRWEWGLAPAARGLARCLAGPGPAILFSEELNATASLIPREHSEDRTEES
jgi:hypothetical protein